MNDGIVDTERLSHERGVRYLHCMAPRGEIVSLINKCLWDEVVLGAVKGCRLAVIDLDCVGAIHWPNRPIDLHGGTYLIIRKRVFVRRAHVHYPKTVSRPTDKRPDVMSTYFKRVNNPCIW